jgi:hypothetical protein
MLGRERGVLAHPTHHTVNVAFLYMTMRKHVVINCLSGLTGVKRAMEVGKPIVLAAAI